jgi:hypothetical protein
MTPRPRAILAVSILPSLLASLLFYAWLGHRRDYLGHFAAGYGGTLCAAACGLALIPVVKYQRIGLSTVVPCTMLCIAAGAAAEATVFCLAKFDPIDFCNQSLGAIFAGLAAVSLGSDVRPTDDALRCLIAIGILYLLAGAYFAVT